MNKILRKSLTLAFTLVCATSLAGCGEKTDTKPQADKEVADTGSETASPENEEAENKEGTSAGVYNIGGIGPLTGDASSYGISVKQGAEVAIAEINAAGGVNGKELALVFEDDVCDEEKAINAYNKVMDSEPVAIMGAVTSGCSIAVSSESVNDGILQITPSGSALECAAEDNSFRICFTDPLQGEVMAKYMSEQGFKNVAIIYDVASDYSKGIKESFVSEAESNGMTIVSDESFTSGDVDFKTQLTKIKDSGADCLFLPIYYAEVAAISEQAKTVGVELPYFGCDGWDGVIAQLEGDTSAIEGAIFLTPFVATSEKAEVKAFVESYQSSYNTLPDQFAADGYDAIYAIKLALEECGDDVTNEKMIEAMTKIDLKGLTGDMTFTAEGEPNKSAMVAAIENGEYVAK